MKFDRAGFRYILDRVSVSAIAPILRKQRSPLLAQWGTTFGGGHISSIELIRSQPNTRIIWGRRTSQFIRVRDHGMYYSGSIRV